MLRPDFSRGHTYLDSHNSAVKDQFHSILTTTIAGSEASTALIHPELGAMTQGAATRLRFSIYCSLQIPVSIIIINFSSYMCTATKFLDFSSMFSTRAYFHAPSFHPSNDIFRGIYFPKITQCPSTSTLVLFPWPYERELQTM